MNYIKTELGQKAFKERAPLLSGRQRSVFILFDGARSPEAVLAYLLTTSAGKPPLPVLECVLLRFGANNEASRREVAQWLRESGERALVQADMLAAHAATKWGPL